MPKLTALLIALCLVFAVHAQQLSSPNGNFHMDFSLTTQGSPSYHLTYKGREIIKPSTLGLALKADSFSLIDGFVIADSARNSVNTTWSPVWGEVKTSSTITTSWP